MVAMPSMDEVYKCMTVLIAKVHCNSIRHGWPWESTITTSSAPNLTPRWHCIIRSLLRRSSVWVLLRGDLAGLNMLTDLSYSQLATGSVAMIWNDVLMFGKKSWSMCCRTFSGESNSFTRLPSTSHQQPRCVTVVFFFCNSDITSWEGSKCMNSVISCEEAASKVAVELSYKESSIWLVNVHL